MTSSGYKTNKTGFELGTKFEYLEDFKLELVVDPIMKKLKQLTASATQQKQEGDYWDTFKFGF